MSHSSMVIRHPDKLPSHIPNLYGLACERCTFEACALLVGNKLVMQ